MRDLGLNLGNAALSLFAAIIVGGVWAFVASIVLMLVYSVGPHSADRGGFAFLGILLYVGLPSAVLCTLAVFVIFYKKLSSPDS
jgi:hypothetical protein